MLKIVDIEGTLGKWGGSFHLHLFPFSYWFSLGGIILISTGKDEEGDAQEWKNNLLKEYPECWQVQRLPFVKKLVTDPETGGAIGKDKDYALYSFFKNSMFLFRRDEHWNEYELHLGYRSFTLWIGRLYNDRC
jgi:hypothetical protein